MANITRVKRKVVKIDEEKCNGCGLCMIACAEGALQIVDGKAKLISDKYCDGLGACLGECPQGAITVEERDAEEFDEKAVEHHLEQKRHAEDKLPCGCPSTTVVQFEKQAEEKLPCGCSSATVTQFQKQEAGKGVDANEVRQESKLGHWPVQLTLVPPTAPFLQGADLVLIADCVPFAYANFHQDFLKDHAVLVACPKLDDFPAHQAKLTEILRKAQLNSLTVVHMEVPCCAGLVHMAKQAIAASGKDIPFEEITISVRGERLQEK
jgi:Pyruvate/2-oxoacid:ferredoxin oxidoreductase delta subunit